MSLEDGRLYTPNEVAENGWLGPDATASALRKAATRGLEHTRYPPKPTGRIYFTRANILATQAKGLQPVDSQRGTAATTRRGRRSVTAAIGSTEVTELRPEPGRARKTKRESA